MVETRAFSFMVGILPTQGLPRSPNRLANNGLGSPGRSVRRLTVGGAVPFRPFQAKIEGLVGVNSSARRADHMAAQGSVLGVFSTTIQPREKRP
jgi:hypothetical protein